MDDFSQQVHENKSNRGFIIRCIVRGSKYQMLVRQIVNSMISYGVIISPDISKYLAYLESGGYIEYTDRKVTSYTAYAQDAVVRLTKKGIDLAELTIEDDGVVV